MAQRLDALVEYFAARRRTESRLRHVERLRASSNIDRSQASDAIADLDYVSSMKQRYFLSTHMLSVEKSRATDAGAV